RDLASDNSLLYAACVGDVKSIKLLVTEVSKDILKYILDQLNFKGDTPLMCAIKAKHIKAFKALVQLGANIYHANSVDGNTPLKQAIYRACKGDLSYMQVLKKYASLELKVASESQ